MVPFFVALLQSLFRGFAERLILPDVLKKVSLTCKLSQLDRKDKSIQKRTSEVSFSIVYDLCVLKNEGKMTDFKMNIFKTEVKNIYVHPMQPLISSFTCSAHFWFLWKMVVQPFQKLCDGKLVTSSVADDAKKEF